MISKVSVVLEILEFDRILYENGSLWEEGLQKNEAQNTLNWVLTVAP